MPEPFTIALKNLDKGCFKITSEGVKFIGPPENIERIKSDIDNLFLKNVFDEPPTLTHNKGTSAKAVSTVEEAHRIRETFKPFRPEEYD